MKADSPVTKMSGAIRAAGFVLAALGVVWLTVELVDRAVAEESRPERRDRIENMSAAEKEALRRKQERFAKLEPSEKERLRALNRDLAAEDDAEELKRIMLRYHDWLMNSVSPGVRSELLRLDPAERIERIKELKNQERQRKSRVLSMDDYGITIRWLRDWVIDNEEEILRNIPPEHRRGLQHDRIDKGERSRTLVRIVFALATDRRMRRFPYSPSLEDLNSLADQLSNPAREKLNEAATADGKFRQVREWLQRTSSPGRRFRPEMWDVSQEKLEEFFSGLDDEERDQLLSLSADEFQRQLRYRYLRNQLGQMRPEFQRDRRRPEGPPPEGRFRRDDRRRGPPPGPDREPPPRPGFERPPKEPTDRGAPI